ncbi:MAG: hypothetical protein GVY05_06185 [Bacteroidetes bacterium]|jgi:hydroxymethylglutaryl-CoA synthase|nr:hypothetical protein [Bacteroidota bacterium]
MNTGISHIAYDIPKIYLNIEDFSKERQINAEKLKKGLGIHKMAFLDQHEDDTKQFQLIKHHYE